MKCVNHTLSQKLQRTKKITMDFVCDRYKFSSVENLSTKVDSLSVSKGLHFVISMMNNNKDVIVMLF